jgi:MFS family permease
VGSGFLARFIVASVGGADKVAWLTIVVTVHPILLGPPVAQAADLWGRKWFVVGAMMAGTVGCIIVSRSTSIGMAIAGQAIAGINMAAQGLVLSITSEILPRRYRPWAQASIHVGAGIGAIIGLYVGGALCRNSAEGFRNYWYLTAAIFFVGGSIIAVFYRPPLRELQHLTVSEKIRRFDLPGVALTIVALLGICLGLGWSQNPFNWYNAHVLVPFLVGVVGLFCVCGYYIWLKKDGIMHHGLFQGSRNYLIGLICTFCEGVAFFAANNYFGFEVSFIFDRDLLLTGATYSITWITYMIATLIAGWYCSRTKTLKPAIIFSFAAFVLFFGLMVSVGRGSSTAVWGYGVFLGIGLGVSINVVVVIAQMSIPNELIATGTSVILSIRACGGTIGLAIYNAIFNAALSASLGPKISQAALTHGLPRSSLPQLISALANEDYAAVQTVPGINREIIEVSVVALKEAFLVGFHNVYITATVFGFVALIGEFF